MSLYLKDTGSPCQVTRGSIRVHGQTKTARVTLLDVTQVKKIHTVLPHLIWYGEMIPALSYLA